MRRLILAFALPALFAGSIWSAGGGTAHAADPTRYVSPSGSDAANTCTDKNHPCQHIQYAVTVAISGDTIVLAQGTYVEQITISKSLNIRGSGIDKSNIKAPDVKILDARSNTFIVEMSGGATVGMTNLTVRGPGAVGGGNDCAPNSLSLDNGIVVIGGSTLNFSEAAVRDIYDQPASGCQRGFAIAIGTECAAGVCTPDVGHATIRNSLISIFQKDGVVVAGAVAGTASSLTMERSAVVNKPSTVIASNGVEVDDTSLALVRGNVISGNECNIAQPVCGPDLVNNYQAAGILNTGADPSSRLEDNTVYGNDMGIYTNDRATIGHNNDSSNRYVNMYVDSATSGAQITRNQTDSGNYGIYVNSGNAGGNTFANDTAHHNSVYDFYFGGGGTSVFKHNSCDTAFPNKSFWDCTSDNGHGDNGDNGGDNNGNPSDKGGSGSDGHGHGHGSRGGD